MFCMQAWLCGMACVSVCERALTSMHAGVGVHLFCEHFGVCDGVYVQVCVCLCVYVCVYVCVSE